MRHLVGLVLGVVLAPVLLYALGWSTATAAASWSAGSGSLTADGMVAAGVLALAGVGIAALTRGLPPLSALVVGTAFAALTATNLLYLPGVEKLLQPVSMGMVHVDWTGARGLLDQGVLAALGIALVVSAAVPRRWRREFTEEDEDYISYLGSGPDPAWGPAQPGFETGGHVQPVQLPPTTAQPASGRQDYGTYPPGTYPPGTYPAPGTDPGTVARRGQHERG